MERTVPPALAGALGASGNTRHYSSRPMPSLSSSHGYNAMCVCRSRGPDDIRNVGYHRFRRVEYTVPVRITHKKDIYFISFAFVCQLHLTLLAHMYNSIVPRIICAIVHQGLHRVIICSLLYCILTLHCYPFSSQLVLNLTLALSWV